MHPSGSSFAYLAYKFDEKYRKSDWVKGHISYFHLSELGELRDNLGLLPGFFNVLSALNKDNQLGLFNKDNILITPQFILFLQWDIFNIYNYRYIVYKREIVDSYLGKNTSYQLSFHQPGIHCFFKEGQVCWNLNTASILAQASFSKLSLFVLLIALIVIVVWSLYANLKRERDDSERRKLALRVLTHELRTPISSMMFRIETLMQNIQEMDDESQIELLKLSGDTHRLMRLSEMSRHYLSVTSGKSKVTISSVTIPSLNNFVQDLLDDQEGIIFNPLPVDTSFVIDEYWLSICLKNLVNNAFDHGQPPVVITLNLHNKVDRELEIEVKDNGSCQFTSFEQMGGEFVKGGESKGSGLGLNIVSQVIEEIGGVIEFYPNPTRFVLKIKERKYAD
jgi:signal transduction histidine kinase